MDFNGVGRPNHNGIPGSEKDILESTTNTAMTGRSVGSARHGFLSL